MELHAIPEAEKLTGGVVGSDAIHVLTFEQLEHLWWECVNYKSHEAQIMVLKDSKVALHPDDSRTIDTAAALSGNRGLTHGPSASVPVHTVQRLIERSTSVEVSEHERNLSRSTIRRLHATPIRVRSESLSLLDTAFEQSRAENVRQQFYKTMSNGRVAARLRQKFRTRQSLGHTVHWAKRVQARWRMFKLREAFRRTRRSAIIIQARWRGLRARTYISHTLTNTTWHFMSTTTVYVANIIGALEAPGKLKASLTHALKHSLKGSKAANRPKASKTAKAAGIYGLRRMPVVINCQMRIRERPQASWALVTFGKSAARMMVLDAEREGWSDELSTMVDQGENGGNNTEAWGNSGIQFTEIDVDQALGSTGAFGWTFKSAQKNVQKAVYKLHKAEQARRKQMQERKEAKLRLQVHAEQAYGTDSMLANPSPGVAEREQERMRARFAMEEREQERVRARFAMERAQCLCPLSRLPMRWPVVAADGFVYERAAISRWLDQKGLFSPVTGAPLKNALLVQHRPLAAAAQEVESSSQSNSSLMHAYTTSLRVSTMLGAARVDTSSQSAPSSDAAGKASRSKHGGDGDSSRGTDGTDSGGCLWDGGTNANLLLADTQAAKAALRHGVLLSKRRKEGQQRCPHAAVAVQDAAEAPVAAPPSSPRQGPRTESIATPSSPGHSQGNRAARGPSQRRLRPASAPTAREHVDAKPDIIDGQHCLGGYSGNHGRGGLGGGGGSAHHGMLYSQAEIVGFSPRFWPSTPTVAKTDANGRTSRGRTSSPAARIRAELTQEYKRQTTTQPRQRGPMNGFTVVGFGSGSEVSREPYFVPSVSNSDLAKQAATRQAAAVVKALSSGAQLQQPSAPPCLWTDMTGGHRDNVAPVAFEERQPGEKRNQDADAVGARLLEEWHRANER